MVKHCAGLPLAIVVLGGTLATKHILSEWRRVHDNIKSFLRKGRGRETERLGGASVPDVLALSYDELPFQLKPCFLHLGHFPEDFEIPTKELIQLWMAEGIISQAHCECCLRELIDRCMVQIGKRSSREGIKTCRVHDLMRDMCLLKANEENFLHVINPSHVNEDYVPTFTSAETTWIRFHRLAIFFNTNLSISFPLEFEDNPHLRSLVGFNYGASGDKQKLRRQMKSILNKFKMLRVLKLEGIRGIADAAYKLPSDIGDLIHLRFLSIRNSSLALCVPSSIGNLVCLQTLNLSSEHPLIIPNVLWKLKLLRHLYLPSTFKLKCGKFRLANLRNLQTLVNLPAKHFDLYELINFPNLRKLLITDLGITSMGKFENLREKGAMFNRLRSLSFSISHNSIFLIEVNLETIASVCLRLHKLHAWGGWIRKLPECHRLPSDLTKLTLSLSNLKEDPLPILEKLPYLRILPYTRSCLYR